MTAESQEEIHRKHNSWPLIGAVLFIFIVWLVNFWAVPRLYEEPGIFGDMFGAVNSLFSGLAVAGLAYAIFLQRIELKISKEDSRYTKQILDKQQIHIEAQLIYLEKQSFEDTFFRMITLFSEITNNIDIAFDYGRRHRGKNAFPQLLGKLQSKIGEEFCPFDEYYMSFYKNYSSDLGHYFRILFNIIAFIDRSNIKNKNFYAKIVRAQLSDAETSLLFYNCLSTNGIEKFKPLVEKYGLLKNMRSEYIFDPSLKEKYEKTAFGKDIF